MSLTLYSNSKSRGQIARWMLEETRQPYDLIETDFGPAMRSAEFLALNPMGKVPVLVHDDAVITETAAICAYLAEAFPTANLAPTQQERADYLRWLFFAAGPVEQAVTMHALNLDPPAERRGMVGFGNFDTVMDVLDAKLSKDEYIAGNRFTAADVYVGAQMIWGLMFGTVPNRDSFAAYANRLRNRPAWQRAHRMVAA